MNNTVKVRFAQSEFDTVVRHLFPGDHDEHGLVLLAGVSQTAEHLTLHVREVHTAAEGVDYTEGQFGYRALSPRFIHRMITRARDEKLAYLAVHNHGTDREVGFSGIDLDSHERGYPALLQIGRGMPVGALVFGTRSVAADVWLANGSRLTLDQAVVAGPVIKRLRSAPPGNSVDGDEAHERQIRMFGRLGQCELATCRVGIIGLGGIGSLVAEYLARLGVAQFCLVDDDRVETSNLSRIVGSTVADAQAETTKTAVAERQILQANAAAIVRSIEDDVAKESVAKELTSCDYLFLAADSMRARLVFNAIVHQYLIPGVQLGAKVRGNSVGTLMEVMSANRPVRPGAGCLWCNELIDPAQLAKEAKTEEERKAQAYGVEEPNPSVISLNAVAAAHAVNDFLLDYLDLRATNGGLHYEHFHFLKHVRTLVQPRKAADCPECSNSGVRYGRGNAVPLPCIEG